MNRKDIVIRGAGVLVVAGVLAGGGSYVINEGGGPEPGNAHLWIDTNGGTCVRQATPGEYVDAQACSGMGAAYDEAEAGDTVLMQGGTYPQQVISFRSLGSTNVVFAVVAGETVEIDDGMDVMSSDVTIHGGDTIGVDEEENRLVVYGAGGYGLDVNGCQGNTITDVQLEDVHTRSVYFGSGAAGQGGGCALGSGADSSRIRFSEVGPTTMTASDFCSDLVLPGGDGHIIEYNLIHDNHLGGCEGDPHIDGIDFDLTNGVIRGNRIWHCGTQCVFTGDESSALIEHNMIEETNACTSGCGVNAELSLMGDMEVRFNTIEGGSGYGVDTDSGCSPQPECLRPGDSNVHHNVWLGGPGCQTDTTGVVTVVCDSNASISGSGGTNSVNCTPVMDRTNAAWTNTDQKAAFFFDATDTCNADGTYGATDPLIPTWDGTPP